MKIDSTQNLLRGLTDTQKKLSESLNKLSSGSAFRSPPSGSELTQNTQATQDLNAAKISERELGQKITQIKVRDAELTRAGSGLQRLRELALESSNGSLSDVDRLYLQNEYSQRLDQLRSSSGQDFPEIDNLKTSAVSSQATAESSLEGIDVALDKLNQERSKLGAEMSQLESRQSYESMKKVNAASAQSNSEVDYASEISELKRLEIVHKAQLKSLKSQLEMEKDALSGLFKTKI